MTQSMMVKEREKVSNLETDRPQLSVVVPIYGVEKYLKQCIDSIRQSSYKELEIILVDDGSEGSESIICDEYARVDSRIKVIHKVNAGLVAARKTGIEMASSEYITFVDGDDFIDKDYYEKIMRWVIDETPDMVAVNFYQYYDDDRKDILLQNIENGVYENEGINYVLENMNCKKSHYYDYGIWPSTWSKVYKKSLLEQLSKEIPNEIKIGEDSAFTFPYILHSKKIVVDNDITGYYYRYVDDSMTKSISDGLIHESTILYKYLRPFYYSTNNADIIKQIELFRVYLINMILTKWNNDLSVKNIHLKCKKLKHIVEKTDFFNTEMTLAEYDVPARFIRQIKCIKNGNWGKLELVLLAKLLKRNIRKMIKRR